MIDGVTLPRGEKNQDEIYALLSKLNFNTPLGAKLTFAPVTWDQQVSLRSLDSGLRKTGLSFNSSLMRERASTTKGKVDETLRWSHRGVTTTLTVSKTRSLTIPLN